MKKCLFIFTIINVFLNISAKGQNIPPHHAELIIEAVNGLLGDTYNEGEGFAAVATGLSGPSLVCETFQQDRKYRCDVIVAVDKNKDDPDSEKGSMLCEGLLFTIDGNDEIAHLHNQNYFIQSCLSSLDDI